ncbi:hypothetical protein M0R45_031247 [Rubus argutus]|uniref:non-specific serine/threonine protein kinase n=1 Tax=Rubus argutus TaxID=59490 RepID=A0AAW1WHS0_RUBAR
MALDLQQQKAGDVTEALDSGNNIETVPETIQGNGIQGSMNVEGTRDVEERMFSIRNAEAGVKPIDENGVVQNQLETKGTKNASEDYTLVSGISRIFKVNFLRRHSHPNLVKLLGYCREENEKLLVFEYMQKGSLENHLFRINPNIEPLSWDSRIKIAIGAARGLAFLHSLDNQVIYRDFKASNILIDLSYNAKISDFGLAKLGSTGGDSLVSTRVMETYRYVVPEYAATGHLYVESDVYGFGVVLLEMLTGLRFWIQIVPRDNII